MDYVLNKQRSIMFVLHLDMGTTATPPGMDGQRPEFMPREFSFRKEEKKPEPLAKDTWWVEIRSRTG